MSHHPLIIVDPVRAWFFRWVGVRPRPAEWQTWMDEDGCTWTGAEQNDHWLVVRHDQHEAHAPATPVDRKEVNGPHAAPQPVRPRCGRLAERILWLLHQRVMQTQRADVSLPDCWVRRALWGPERAAWPRHWRQEVDALLASLRQLRFVEPNQELSDDTLVLAAATALWGTAADDCDADCPLAGQARHHHYAVTVGPGFLGRLEGFAQIDPQTGRRRYDVVRGGRRRRAAGLTLRQLGKESRLISVFLPSKLAPATPHDDLLQAVVRETTRAHGRDRQLGEAAVLSKNLVRNLTGRGCLPCPLLQPDRRYCEFNGNKHRRGLGYRLSSAGGWLAKAGYPAAALDRFLSDLADLTQELALVVVGLRPDRPEFFDLTQLRALAATAPGRRLLERVHVRIYTEADYVQRWTARYRWHDGWALRPAAESIAIGQLRADLAAAGVRQAELAHGLKKDPAFVSRLFNGRKSWPAGLLEQAQQWLAARRATSSTLSAPLPPPSLSSAAASSAKPTTRSTPPDAPAPAGPSLRSPGTILETALACRAWGWSVVPQHPGAKQPTVRWKVYQQRLASAEELRYWLNQWPDAGLAIVLGPVSNLFVIDVDGSAAHAALLAHLGQEPVAPKALSGSRQPDRYHLFFRHPACKTKAKATPWHPQLEFRGQGGVVVLPPSLHKSGNCYTWADGRAPGELALPEVPDAVLDALQPARKPVQSRPIMPVPLAGDVSPTTRLFLAGKYADGPRWNDRLFHAGCDLAGRGVGCDRAEEMLLAGAQPWDAGQETAARQTIRSAYAQPREPGVV